MTTTKQRPADALDDALTTRTGTVYGVHVKAPGVHPGAMEAMFSTETAADEYAAKRSEEVNGDAFVTRFGVDLPDTAHARRSASWWTRGRKRPD